MNPQGKVPLLIAEGNFPIPESDTICRYILEKYKSSGPSFIPTELKNRILSEQICRLHDIYISPIQASMYRAPGSIFSIYGTDRKAALSALKKQLEILEYLVSQRGGGDYLCGSEISLAGLY